MASVKELREALAQALRTGNYEEAEFWRTELVDRLVHLSAAIRDSSGASEADE
jgi:DUF438 domain-containing protein